ncbi:MAG: tetratricopeptide repeat protein [Bacteroidota bacterium]
MNKPLVYIFFLVVNWSAISQNALLENANNLFQNGKYSEAIEVYKSHDNPSEVCYNISKAYVAIGNFGAALESYKRCRDSNTENRMLAYDYAKLLIKMKRYEEASKLFDDLLGLDNQNPDYHYQKGVTLEKLKDSTAVDRFVSAYELDQTHQKAIFKIAKHHLIKRNHVESHKYIDKGLESYSANIELISLKAQNYYYQQYYTNAIPWFEKLLELGEESEFIHEKLSICHAQNSDYEPAIKHRKLALKYNPFDANAMYVIGSYYERLNDFENAEAYIVKSLKLKDIPLGDEYQKLAMIYNRQKKYDLAIENLKKSIKEDPTNESAQFFLVRTKDELYADLDSRIKLYEDFKKRFPKSPYHKLADYRLEQLKEEKFLKKD